MRGFVDLHCHWIAGIDDGCRTTAEGVALLRALHEIGFSTVVATPHMRPGMFDNDKTMLENAYAAMRPALEEGGALPDTHLSSEHFFDDIVFGRLVKGAGLPYPGSRAALVEFGPMGFPAQVTHRFFDLKRKGLTPVVAHPERYEQVWKNDACLDPLLDAGAHLLLDVQALVGRYGKASQRAAEKLLEDDAYEAACSDAHKPADAEHVARAVARLTKMVGDEETNRLLAEGPRAILSGEARNGGA